MNRIRSPSGEPCERRGGCCNGEGRERRREGWKEGMKGEKEVKRRESEMTEKGEVG